MERVTNFLLPELRVLEFECLKNPQFNTINSEKLYIFFFAGKNSVED